MKIQVNGKAQELAEAASVAEILEGLDLRDRYLAVALNWKVIRREDYAKTKLSEGDELEIVSPSAGG